MTAKAVTLFALLLFALSSCTDSGDSRWKQYSENPVSTYSYDVKSVTHPSEQFVRVWYRSHMKDPAAKGWFDSRGTKGLVEFSCAGRQYRVIELQFYDDAGKTLYTFTETSGEMPRTIWQWSQIEPGNTSYEPLYRIVCKR